MYYIIRDRKPMETGHVNDPEGFVVVDCYQTGKRARGKLPFWERAYGNVRIVEARGRADLRQLTHCSTESADSKREG